MLNTPKKPKYALFEYRKFIREASPYVSIVAGRRILPADADSMSDERLTELAILIDERAGELVKKPLPEN